MPICEMGNMESTIQFTRLLYILLYYWTIYFGDKNKNIKCYKTLPKDMFYFKFSPFKGKPCTQPFTHIADTCKHSTNTAHGTQLEQIKY